MPVDSSGEGGPEQQLPDPRLLARARSGERDALEELCRNSWKPIYRFVLHRCDNTAEAEDLTQSVFLRALSALPGFEDRGIPFDAYLFRTARNLLVDRWRSAAVRPSSIVGISDELVADHPSNRFDDSVDERNELLDVFDRLSPAHREVLRLRLIEGHTSAGSRITPWENACCHSADASPSSGGNAIGHGESGLSYFGIRVERSKGRHPMSTEQWSDELDELLDKVGNELGQMSTQGLGPRADLGVALGCMKYAALKCRRD